MNCQKLIILSKQLRDMGLHSEANFVFDLTKDAGKKKKSKKKKSKKKKRTPTKPDLWQRAIRAAKNKFEVYPSAYANGWALRWYKKRGGGWRGPKPKK